MAWLTGWGRRKSHNLNGQAGAGTNYQVGIKVYYGAGADGTEVVDGNTMGKIYCNGHCKNDFGDVRFTDDDGSSELAYWLQEKVDGSHAIFWVKVTDDLTNNQLIYVYYGNAGATTTSDGISTFIRWDDFDLGYIVGDVPKPARGWVVNQGGDSDYVKIVQDPDDPSNLVCEINNATQAFPYPTIQNDFSLTAGVAVHYRMRSDSPAGGNAQTNLREGANIRISATWGGSATTFRIQYYKGVYLDYVPVCLVSDATWYTLEFRGRAAYHHIVKAGTDHAGDLRSAIVAGLDAWSQGLNQGNKVTNWFIDRFFIRKFVIEVGLHGAWGSEETKVHAGASVSATMAAMRVTLILPRIPTLVRA